MKKRIIAMALAAMMFMGLAACGGKKDGNTIKIGGLAPLTGDVSIYGISSSNGSKLFFKQQNENGGVLGKEIDFILMDEKGDASEAVNAFNRLVESDKIEGLIGDVTSAPSIAVADVAGKIGIPMISPTGTAEKITTYGDNIFRACYLDTFQGEVLGRFAAENLGVTKVAVLYNKGDEYSSGVRDAFVKSAEAAGIEIVKEETYSGNDNDFRSQLTNIASSGAEALCVPEYYSKVVLIARQAREAGIDIPMLGPDGWDGLLAVAGDDNTFLENCYFTNHYSPKDENPAVQDFLKAYRAEYNEEPTAFAALGYDAAMIMTRAIENAGSTDPAAVSEEIKKIQIPDGVTGNIIFDEGGNPIKSVSIIVIRNGEYELFIKM